MSLQWNPYVRQLQLNFRYILSRLLICGKGWCSTLGRRYPSVPLPQTTYAHAPVGTLPVGKHIPYVTTKTNNISPNISSITPHHNTLILLLKHELSFTEAAVRTMVSLDGEVNCHADLSDKIHTIC